MLSSIISTGSNKFHCKYKLLFILINENNKKHAICYNKKIVRNLENKINN